MAVCLSKLSTAAQGCLLRRGPRVFGLLGKVTPSGLAPFTGRDVPGSWALTAEFGCLRLERLSGDEEVTGMQMYLPVPSSFDYGVTGTPESYELARAVFGMLAPELEQLVTALRRGSFPGAGLLSQRPAVQRQRRHHSRLLASCRDLEHGSSRQRALAGDVHAGGRRLHPAKSSGPPVPQPPTRT